MAEASAELSVDFSSFCTPSTPVSALACWDSAVVAEVLEVLGADEEDLVEEIEADVVE